MVGTGLETWETTLAHSPSPALVADWAQDTSARAALFRATIQKRFVERAQGQQVLSEPDPLALAVVLEPEIVQQAETRYVEIELAGQLTRGQTVIDWYDVTGRPHNAQLVLEVDRERFAELMRLGLQ